MRFRTRDYGRVTERDLEAEAEAERVAAEQIQRSDAEREAASHRKTDDEWTVYDLIHGAAWYDDDDPKRR